MKEEKEKHKREEEEERRWLPAGEKKLSFKRRLKSGCSWAPGVLCVWCYLNYVAETGFWGVRNERSVVGRWKGRKKRGGEGQGQGDGEVERVRNEREFGGPVGREG